MKNLARHIFIVYGAVIVIYIATCFLINKGNFGSSTLPYYNYLIDAFFHGRFNLVNPPSVYDLIIFQNKYFLFWGPGPILFILPFYILFRGLSASDVVYTLIAGCLNVILFKAVLNKFNDVFKIKLKTFDKIFLILNFALASPNLFLSVAGRIWFTEQTVSIFYLLLFLFFYFSFLRSLRTKDFIFSTIFLNFAWTSRYTLLSYFILFVYAFLILKRRIKRTPFRYLSLFFLISSLFIISTLTYNYVRFGSPLELGLKYLGLENGITNNWFHEKVVRGETFSLFFLENNIKHYFLEPILIKFTKPFIQYDIFGNSVFSVYPILLLVPFIFQKKYFSDNKKLPFLYCSGVTILSTIFILLMYLATGSFQFGNRYFFDVIPMLFLLISFSLEKIPLPIKLLILMYGIAVNILGVISFFSAI